LKIEDNGEKVEDPERLANIMADFFEKKIELLVEKTGLGFPSIPNLDQIPNSELIITDEMIREALKKLRPKKSCGYDQVPMIVIKDTADLLMNAYRKVFQDATIKIPDLWKLSLVRPLHKSGDKMAAQNYRPISNLCSLEKVFEKIILHLIDENGEIDDGKHQHGYKKNHSTTTAAVTIQSLLAEKLDQKQNTILYSLDLSAAFDMLRQDKFYEIMKETIPGNIMRILIDFLSQRKCVVDVEGSLSTIRNVPLGCVQGSVLGPRLFSLYTSKIPQKVPGHIVTYADDSYVLVSTVEHEALVPSTEKCLETHVEELRQLGMVVNEKKTEAVYFNRLNPMKLEIRCGEERIQTGNEMKVLGIIFNERLKWDSQIKKTISKANSLTHGLKFLRKKLTKSQFINATTSLFYGLFYYGSQVWLGEHTTSAQLKRLNSVHYRHLRIIEGDWKKEKRREELDKIGRTKPSTWSKYSCGNMVIKIMNEKQPVELFQRLSKKHYTERRKPFKMKFHSDAITKTGFQGIENRLVSLFNILDFDHYGLTRDQLRIN